MTAALPSVTVLMTTFNGEQHVAEAIQSVIAQTHADWELLVVDDGSGDRTREIVAGLAAAEPRIRLHPLPANVGMAAALNAGLDAARGRYVARLDQDDVALPGRLAAQLRFLEAHPQVAACGTWVSMIGASSAPVCWPADADECRCELLFGPALVDPSVMVRSASLREHGLRYRTEFELAEDYDFWLRLADLAPVCNVPLFLLNYRVHTAQVSAKRAVDQAAVAARLHRRALASLGVSPDDAELALHMGLRGDAPVDEAFVSRAERWLRGLLAANRLSGRYPPRALRKVVGRYWLATCRRLDGTFVARTQRWLSSPLALSIDRPLGRLLGLLRARR